MIDARLLFCITARPNVKAALPAGDQPLMIVPRAGFEATAG
jgi:hypothetical protein